MTFDPTMTDFETHPVGTGKRVEELEAKLHQAIWALEPFNILAKHHAADAPEWGPFDSVSAQVSIMYLRDAMTTLATLIGQDDE